MKQYRWQIAIVLLAGLIVGILLIFEQPKSNFGTADTPNQGGTYTEGMIGHVQRLNPLFDSYNQTDHDINRLIFSGLIKFDDRGIPQNDLAESVGIAEDGLTYTYILRDAKWHDGAPLLADDVLFTINLIRSETSTCPEDIKKYWQSVEVNVLDQKTVQFKLSEAFAPFQDYLTFGLLPRHLLDGKTFDQILDDPFNLHPIGTGPFRFAEFKTQNGEISGVTLKANTSYYAQPPYLEEITFIFYADAVNAFQAFHDGIVQGISHIPASLLSSALVEPNLSLYTSRLPQLSMVMFNLADPQLEFLQQKIVRQALYMGINRQYMIDRLLNGQAILANSPILPDTWAYYEGTPSVSYDPEKAMQLLKEAGYVISSEPNAVRKKEEVALRFTLLHPDDELHTAIAQMIQQNWQDLNVAVELQAVSYDDLITNHLVSRDFQAALVDLNLSRTPDPDPYPFWDQAQASGGQNYSQWENRVASEYLETARITVDLQERARLYRNFQVVFSEELPAIPLYNPVYTFGVNQKIQGVRVGPMFDVSDRFSNISSWHLVTGMMQPQPNEQPTP